MSQKDVKEMDQNYIVEINLSTQLKVAVTEVIDLPLIWGVWLIDFPILFVASLFASQILNMFDVKNHPHFIWCAWSM